MFTVNIVATFNLKRLNKTVKPNVLFICLYSIIIQIMFLTAALRVYAYLGRIVRLLEFFTIYDHVVFILFKLYLNSPLDER